MLLEKLGFSDARTELELEPVGDEGCLVNLVRYSRQSMAIQPHIVDQPLRESALALCRPIL